MPRGSSREGVEPRRVQLLDIDTEVHGDGSRCCVSCEVRPDPRCDSGQQAKARPNGLLSAGDPKVLRLLLLV
jgi:hypothetical protein